MLLRGHPDRLLMLSATICALCIAVPDPTAKAACNVIPLLAPGFRGAKGTIDRPFAMPDENQIAIELKAPCASGTLPADAVVTFIFEPITSTTGGKPARNAIVVKSDCYSWGKDDQQKDCRAALNQGMPPDRHGEAYCQKGKVTVHGARVDFAFPDSTGAKLEPKRPGADPFAGPVTIAVTAAATTELPCGLATHSCLDFPNPEMLSACIDDLYSAEDTQCGVTIDPTFPNFTALPKLNDFKKICSKDSDIAPKCEVLSKAKDIRFALDNKGNALLPIKWRGVLRKKGTGTGGNPSQDCQPVDDCDNRLLRGSTAVRAFETLNGPINLSSSALASFNLQGGNFQPPPAFLVAGDLPQELSLTGDADKGESVLRFNRCPDAACTQPAFDFSGRATGGGVGPVIIQREQDRRVCDGGSKDGELCTDPFECGQECQPAGQSPAQTPAVCKPVACVAFRGKAKDFAPRGTDPGP